MREALKDGGFVKRLSVARDGEQAIAFLRRQAPFADATEPALILLDLNLPRMNGGEVLAEIKRDRNLRHIPVFIVSTSTREEDIAASYDLHANCYIPKPIDLEGLIDMGRLIEAFWLRLAVLPASVSPRLRPPAFQKIS